MIGAVEQKESAFIIKRILGIKHIFLCSFGYTHMCLLSCEYSIRIMAVCCTARMYSTLVVKHCMHTYHCSWLNDHEDSQMTDVHYGVKSGECSFNWTFAFSFNYIIAGRVIITKKVGGVSTHALDLWHTINEACTWNICSCCSSSL